MSHRRRLRRGSLPHGAPRTLNCGGPTPRTDCPSRSPAKIYSLPLHPEPAQQCWPPELGPDLSEYLLVRLLGQPLHAASRSRASFGGLKPPSIAFLRGLPLSIMPETPRLVPIALV